MVVGGKRRKMRNSGTKLYSGNANTVVVQRNNNNNNSNNNPAVKEDMDETGSESGSDSKSIGASVASKIVDVIKTKEKEKRSDDDAPSPQPEKILYDNRIKRKNVLALNEKVAAMREYEKMPVYKRIGRMFHCSPDQIKRIVQQRESILKAWEQRTRRCQDAKSLELKVVRVSMLGKAVYEWLRRMMYYKDFMITDGLIQKMALQFKSAMGLQNFFPHQDWCDKFRHTYKIHDADSKQLKIAYGQGHSVQIKDVIKDVLSECTPTNGDHARDDDEDTDEEDNDDSIDEKPSAKERKPLTNQNLKLKPCISVRPTSELTASRPMPRLQPIRQLVALPIKTSGIAGMPQKVLVATPITPGGVSGVRMGSGKAPMTMTIIPLATLAQANNIASTSASTSAAAAAAATASTSALATPTPSTSAAALQKQHSTVPPPILEIKQELKEDNEDADESEQVGSDVAEGLHIKQECISEEDEVENEIQEQKQLRLVEEQRASQQIVELQQQFGLKLAEHITETNNATRSPLTKQIYSPTPDEYENLTLSSLRKIMQHNNNDNNEITLKIPSRTTDTPPMPPLTRAPNAVRQAQKRKHKASNLPPIKSCAEARCYLKLLEDFALVKENFRLIALVTRADEVLRELDGNDDVDID